MEYHDDCHFDVFFDNDIDATFKNYSIQKNMPQSVRGGSCVPNLVYRLSQKNVNLTVLVDVCFLFHSYCQTNSVFSFSESAF